MNPTSSWRSHSQSYRKRYLTSHHTK